MGGFHTVTVTIGTLASFFCFSLEFPYRAFMPRPRVHSTNAIISIVAPAFKRERRCSFLMRVVLAESDCATVTQCQCPSLTAKEVEACKPPFGSPPRPHPVRMRKEVQCESQSHFLSPESWESLEEAPGRVLCPGTQRVSVSGCPGLPGPAAVPETTRSYWGFVRISGFPGRNAAVLFAGRIQACETEGRFGGGVRGQGIRNSAGASACAQRAPERPPSLRWPQLWPPRAS